MVSFDRAEKRPAGRFGHIPNATADFSDEGTDVTKMLLSGNEAIAQGAWEAGVGVGVGYPGTPSTETLKYLARLEGSYAEWAPNEKVALETAIGVSIAGKRALCTMKHVGVNVAADPLMTVAYTGVNGGLVILAADDPGIYSSQNEQDSRNYAAFARIPLLEPSDSAEAYSFTQRAFLLSEIMDTPVIVRSTVRISHTKSNVEVAGVREVPPTKEYVKDPGKWVMMPMNAKKRRKVTDERYLKLVAYAERSDLDVDTIRDPKVGIICSGAVYQHVREALPEASTFKLGMGFPLPPERLAAFAAKVDDCYVVEEACDFLDMRIRALGIPLRRTPNALPVDDELTPALIRAAFGLDGPEHLPVVEGLPPRPPALCAGCPHRLVFAELRRIHATVCGDIGCYTLGALPPLCGVDACVDMGASISMAHGMELVHMLDGDEGTAPVVAVIGDSTFAHSGITSLLTIAYNRGRGTICILDNRTTAMTGQQGNPCNGITLQDRPSRELDLVALCEALGVEDVVLVDPMDAKTVRSALKAATASDDLSVIVFKSPCVLVSRTRRPAYHVEGGRCTACGVCVSLGCPALGKDAQDGKAHIDPRSCIGCGQCIQYCGFKAIEEGEKA